MTPVEPGNSHARQRWKMENDRLFESLTLAIPGLVWVSDSYGHVEFNNAQWAQFTGMSQASGLGHGWLEAIHPSDAAAFRARIPFSLPKNETAQAQMRVRRSDGAYHRHLLSIRQVQDGKWIGCAIDAQEWLTTELRDTTQGNILEMVISGAELDLILAELCKAAQRQILGATCTVELADHSGRGYLRGVSPDLPQEVVEAFRGVGFGQKVGLCGAGGFEKRDIVTTNIATDPAWASWREFLVPFGFQSCWSQPVFDSAGEIIAWFSFYFKEERTPKETEQRDLARLRGLASLAIERVRILEALKESEEHYRHTVEQNPQIPWTSDPKGQILSVSSRWTELTGVSRSDALGAGWLQSIHPNDTATTAAIWGESLATGRSLDVNYRIRLRGGAYRWVRARATARLNPNGEILRWYGTVEDVHEQYLASEKLKRQAFTDDLTDLPNRRRFVEELARRLAVATKPIGLLVMDMDDFKLVNDRYGHLTGDAVLRLFARYLQKVVDSSEFVARLGGDEFAIILDEVADEDAILDRARRIESSIDTHLRASRKTRNCKASIGCATGRQGDDPDALFNRADLALYAAKAAGKGTVKQFSPHIRSLASQRIQSLELARTALREDWIVPYYQPIVSLRDNTVRGFEALLRIMHPDRGILTPATIIDALDDPQQADAIALRMAEKVVRDLRMRASGGSRCGQISINLATENLVNDEFIPLLLKLIDGAQIPRNSIKLEITERVLVDQLGEKVIGNLKSLRKSGIGLSLDDFGTGYASLVHLQMLPVDEIKIDRSFVSGIGTDGNTGEIVRAMLGLAKSLGIKTVAEGVEKKVEAKELATLGCDFAQGYLYSRPLPFEEVVGRFACNGSSASLDAVTPIEQSSSDGDHLRMQ
jgi:diguanylate cyclase (GGDEF)-like protein/PAS domain S-box-containing protein